MCSAPEDMSYRGRDSGGGWGNSGSQIGRAWVCLGPEEKPLKKSPTCIYVLFVYAYVCVYVYVMCIYIYIYTHILLPSELLAQSVIDAASR